MDSQEDPVFTQLTEAVAANPDDPSLHFNLVTKSLTSSLNIT